MCLIWLAASFGYYLILMLINTFDNVYQAALTSSLSEMAAYILSGLFYHKIGVKRSLILSLMISTVGGILILAWGLENQSSPWFLVIFLMAKFGVTCCFNINFAANQYFFPVLFSATALGVCNFLARLFSGFSFLISGMEEPLPMWLFTCLCGFTAIAAFFL